MSELRKAYPTPSGYLGHDDRIWGAQAGGDNVFAQLWSVYARADRRWAGADTVRPYITHNNLWESMLVGRVAD